MRMYMRVNFSQPIYDMWMHGVFYYRYNSHLYQRFPIDLWEDLCAWLGMGTEAQYILKWAGENIRKYSNLNHSCPYFGTTWIKVDRIPMNKLIILEPFMPSGRYRVDLNITNGYKKEAFMKTSFYFAISDNRIEKFWKIFNWIEWKPLQQILLMKKRI